MTTKSATVGSKEIESLIKSAIEKINGSDENDVCRYLPGPSGGYMHHFTMRKLKTKSPEKLAELINKYIISPSNPKSIPPKQRAPRGSRKRGGQLIFTKQDIERMLNMARLAGDKEMIRKLTPKKDLRTLKRELISSIRHNRVEPDLWSAYVETVNQQNPEEQENTQTEQVATAKIC